MPVDPVANRRFIESLSTLLEDHLASWKSQLADTRNEINELISKASESIPAQAKHLFPEDLVAALLEDAVPPAPAPDDRRGRREGRRDGDRHRSRPGGGARLGAREGVHLLDRGGADPGRRPDPLPDRGPDPLLARGAPRPQERQADRLEGARVRRLRRPGRRRQVARPRRGRRPVRGGLPEGREADARGAAAGRDAAPPRPRRAPARPDAPRPDGDPRPDRRRPLRRRAAGRGRAPERGRPRGPDVRHRPLGRPPRGAQEDPLPGPDAARRGDRRLPARRARRPGRPARARRRPVRRAPAPLRAPPPLPPVSAATIAVPPVGRRRSARRSRPSLQAPPDSGGRSLFEQTDPSGARKTRRITDAGEALRALEESASAKKKETPGASPGSTS